MESHLQASKILKDFFSKGFRDVCSFAFPIFFTAIFLLALKVIIRAVIIKDLVVSAAKKMTVFVNIRLDHITFISENIQCTINKTKKVDIKNAGFMRPAITFLNIQLSNSRIPDTTGSSLYRSEILKCNVIGIRWFFLFSIIVLPSYNPVMSII